MKEYTRLNIILIFTCLLSYHGFAQVTFDVKTQLEVKEQLHIVKIAVINAIKNSNWASVKDIGENYSLWIDNFEQQANGDSITASYNIELRTPAMFTRGKHIVSKRIIVTFDTVGLVQVPVQNDTTITKLLVSCLEKSGMLEEFIKLISNSVPGAAILVPYIKPFVLNVIKKINRQPTPFESIEANLLAAKTIIDLKNMTSNII